MENTLNKMRKKRLLLVGAFYFNAGKEIMNGRNDSNIFDGIGRRRLGV